MIKISIFIPWFHPAYKAGGPIQSIANMIDEFTTTYIFYDVYTSNLDLGGSKINVQNDKWIKYNSNTQILYASRHHKFLWFKKKKGENIMREILFVIGIYNWRYNLLPLLFCKADKKIISVRGMLHPGALSQKMIKKKIYLGIWKLLRLHRWNAFHATNEEEKKYIQNIFGKKTKIFVAQNFPKIFSQISFPKKTEGVLKLISIALISPMKNHLMVLQALMKCENSINYEIYGPIKDYDYWSKCVEQIKNLPKNVSVNYYGDVPPQQIENILSNSHVFVLPSKSENFGHAIFEALSAGKPVITSHQTPWQKLKELKAGINISTEDITELIDAINSFTVMNKKKYEEWCIGANKYAIDAININEIKDQYQQMFFEPSLHEN